MEDVVANSWRKTAFQFKLLCFIKLGAFCLFGEAETNLICDYAPTSVCLESGGESTKSSKFLHYFL